jgi:YidC/Oxa1 family membrane protein insertase
MNAPEPKQVTLGRRPLAVLRPEIENYQMRGEEPPPGFVDPPSFVLTVSKIQSAAHDAVPKALMERFIRRLGSELEKGDWVLGEHNEQSATFTRTLPELNLELVKRYKLEPVPEGSRRDPDYPGYDLRLELEFRNTGDAEQSIEYRIGGPTGMPLEGWWYAHKISRSRWMGGAGLRDVVMRFDGNNVVQFDGPQLATGEAEPVSQDQALAYAGVDGQYFAAVMIPERKALGDVWFETTQAIRIGPPADPRAPHTFANVTCEMMSKPIVLGPQASDKSKAFTVFIGPKRPNLLAQYKAAGDPDYSLEDIVYYGLSLFGLVARAMLAILHFFYRIVGNYGIAIVMLTVLVRGLMFPISFKQTKNMARMQAL